SSSVQEAALQQQAALFSESDLVRFFHLLAETESSLKDAANPRYQLEVGLVKLMEMRRLALLGELVARIDALENALRTGRPPSERKTSQPAPVSGALGTGATRAATSADSAKSAVANPSEGPQAIEDSIVGASSKTSGSVIDQIKAALEKKRRRLLIAALDGAQRAEIEGDELLIEFAPEAKHYRDTLAKTESVKVLREMCHEVCGREIGIRFAIKESDENEALSPDEETQRAKRQARQAAAQNPTVQQVLRAFGGEIVDVKMQ
ncbi:MAG TPA: hypothetical protein VHD88_02805, partial [Pyrinomonadaceae bacterium]|nr:hypothetical protein [Pyrinomonadaceae bacterium]